MGDSTDKKELPEIVITICGWVTDYFRVLGGYAIMIGCLLGYFASTHRNGGEFLDGFKVGFVFMHVWGLGWYVIARYGDIRLWGPRVDDLDDARDDLHDVLNGGRATSSKKIERRPWQCPICERRYNIPVTAKEPVFCPKCSVPWQCPLCERRYSIPVTMKEPLTCPECTVPTLGLLRHHFKRED